MTTWALKSEEKLARLTNLTMGTVALSREEMACVDGPVILVDIQLPVKNGTPHPKPQFSSKKVNDNVMI